MSGASQEETENLTVNVNPGHLWLSENQRLGSDNPPIPMGGSAQVRYGLVPYTLDLGHMLLRVVENPNCVMTPDRQVYLLRSTGILQIYIFAEDLGCEIPVSLRGLLMRADPDFQHIPVDRICQNHANETGRLGRRFVLQAATNALGRVNHCTNGFRHSVLFSLGRSDERGSLRAVVDFRSMCNSYCTTSDHPSVSTDVRAWSLVLLLTLENPITGEILAQRRISLCIKGARDFSFGLDPFRTIQPYRANTAGSLAAMSPQGSITHGGMNQMSILEDTLKGLVARAIQIGIRQESFVDRVRRLFIELGRVCSMTEARPLND